MIKRSKINAIRQSLKTSKSKDKKEKTYTIALLD